MKSSKMQCFTKKIPLYNFLYENLRKKWCISNDFGRIFGNLQHFLMKKFWPKKFQVLKMQCFTNKALLYNFLYVNLHKKWCSFNDFRRIFLNLQRLSGEKFCLHFFKVFQNAMFYKEKPIIYFFIEEHA